MKVYLIFLFVVLGILRNAQGYKILAVLPIYARSHYNIGNSIASALVNAGHDVTVVQPFPSKNNLTNRRDIFIKEIETEGKRELSFNMFEFGDINPVMTQFFIFDSIRQNLIALFKNEEFQKLLNSGEKFDLVIYEIFGLDALAGLGQHFGCPVIGYTTFPAQTWANQITGNPPGNSYIPNSFLSYTAHMTFPQRVYNVVFGLIEQAVLEFKYYPEQREIYEKNFPTSKSTFDRDLKQISLVFMNNHFTGSSPRHLMPNVIEILGVHVQKPKLLPKEWQTYLDDAKDGVIYFSMGSIVKSTDWPKECREAFIKAFEKLKMKVIWKYENETLPNKPANVKIGKWLPQRDILAHPNVKLFITHGGLLGTTEGLAAGVPVLGIPVYGDQRMNIAKAKQMGYGLMLDYHNEITEEKLTAALNELLDNPKYYETAKIISKQFNDRPLSPQQSVVYWSEYVIRHQGAPQLRSPSNDLCFIEFYLIDVYAVLIAIGILISLCFYKFIKFSLGCLFKRSQPSPKIKSN